MLHRLVRHRDSTIEVIWLTIYGDLITNLLLIFLALYGLTVMGDEALSEALQSMAKNIKNVEAIEHIDDLSVTADILKDKFKLNPDLLISEERNAVRVEFGEQVLFNSGLAVPKAEAVPVLETLADILKAMPHTVVVEGHTDSIPLPGNGRYKNNWELSLARSMSIVRVLEKQGGLPASQMAAAAYGSYRPKASNLTANGRRLNRRVEIALFKDFPYVKPEAN